MQSQARVAQAAQKAGALGDREWDAVKKASGAALTDNVRFTTSVDRQSERLLATALQRGDERVLSTVLGNVTTWGTNRLLRLWRLSPYLQVRLPLWCPSRAPLAGSWMKHCGGSAICTQFYCTAASVPLCTSFFQYIDLCPVQLVAAAPRNVDKSALFDATVPDVGKLAHPSVYMINRAGHLCNVMAACVAAGRTDLVGQLLQIPTLPAAFADVGGDQEGIALALLALADSGTLGESELTVTQGVTDAAETLWTAVTKRGCGRREVATAARLRRTQRLGADALLIEALRTLSTQTRGSGEGVPLTARVCS